MASPVNRSIINIFLTIVLPLILACGGGGGGSSAAPPPQPDLRATWGSAAEIGYLSNGGNRYFQFANPESLNPILTWDQSGFNGSGGFSEFINGVWTKPSFPLSDPSFTNIQAIGDSQGNLTLIGLSSLTIQSATRRGGVWEPVITIGTTAITALDSLDAYPKATLVGGAGVFVIWRKYQPNADYKYDLFVSRLISSQWVTDTIDTGTDGSFRLSGNPDGTAFATWYKNNQIFLTRFNNNAWEAPKALNVVADGISSMSAYRYFLLSNSGSKAILVTTTQADAGLHISTYDGSQIQETVYSQNQRADLTFSADIAPDGSIIVAWTNPLDGSTFSRVFDGIQWGPMFRAVGYQRGARIMDKNTAIIGLKSNDSLIVSVDWTSGSWLAPKPLITSPSVFGMALGRTSQRQWLAAWNQFTGNTTNPLFVIDGKPGR